MGPVFAGQRLFGELRAVRAGHDVLDAVTAPGVLAVGQPHSVGAVAGECPPGARVPYADRPVRGSPCGCGLGAAARLAVGREPGWLGGCSRRRPGVLPCGPAFGAGFLAAVGAGEWLAALG